MSEPTSNEETSDATSRPEESGARWRLLSRRASGDLTIENEGVLDEITLDGWFHLERMREGLWWLRLGDARVLVEVGEGGGAKVSVERGFYASEE